MTLKQAREKAGLSQVKLAKLSGVNIRQIQRTENGTAKLHNMTAGNFLAIAAALGVDPRDLADTE